MRTRRSAGRRAAKISELAQKTACHEPSLFRLLRGLASLGVFAKGENRQFRLTEMAQFL
jgi:DNA-binding IclR family transcriptional regulator